MAAVICGLSVAACADEKSGTGNTVEWSTTSESAAAPEVPEPGNDGDQAGQNTLTGGELSHTGNTSAALSNTGVSQELGAGTTYALTTNECEELALELNSESNYGFLLSVYEQPADIDAAQVFYIGAGIGEYVNSEEEKFAYKSAIESAIDSGEEEDDAYAASESESAREAGADGSEDENADSEGESVPEDIVPSDTEGLVLEDGDALIRVSREAAESYILAKTGVSYAELESKPQWVYLGEYDAYYIVLSEEETNLSTIQVVDATVRDGVITAHYQSKELEMPMDAYHVPVYEVNVKVTADGYQFIANRLWVQNNIMAKFTYEMTLQPVGDAVVCAYEPDQFLTSEADVTFAVLQNGKVQQVLPGVAIDNIRSGYTFQSLNLMGADDYDGDGYSDLFAVCSYSGTAGSDSGTIREDGKEFRYYRGQENGVFVYDASLSAEVSSAVSELSYSNITSYLYEGVEDSTMAATYNSWEEAYAAHIESLDESKYDGFSLIYLDDDRVPELIEMGTTQMQGALVITYHNGKLVESRIGRTFSYLERLNLLCSTSGVPGLYVDTVYNLTGGSLERIQSGTYGYLDATETEHQRVGDLEYSYEWQGAEVTREGYDSAISFIYDARSASAVNPDSLMSAEEILKKLQ